MTYLIYKGISPKDAFNIMEITRKGKAREYLTKDHINTMKEHGVPDWYIESCMKIKYMFPKAHAAAYVIAAIRLGFFKLYYPVEFYSVLLSVRQGEFDLESAIAGIDSVKLKIDQLRQKGNERNVKDDDLYYSLQITYELLARGYEFLPVDLYKSDAMKYKVEGGKIRLPFCSIKGIGLTAAEHLQKSAKGHTYISIEDIAVKSGISKTVIETMNSYGIFKDLPQKNQLSLF
jgi:DNA polymerase-3 subunit alpha (Gram-positive type)